MTNLLLGLLLLPSLGAAPCPGTSTGVDRLGEAPYREWVEGKKVGLITNHTGVNCHLEPTGEVLSRIPGTRVTALFAPEHGPGGAAPAGSQVLSSGMVYSLYGEQRSPTAEMLREVEVLVFDIQDLAIRFYTYLSTLLECMKAAAREQIPFVILDRPVPIDGSRVEGPVLEPGYESFVGSFRLPVRYGMTPGEVARLVNSKLELGARLAVVPLQSWKRDTWLDETGLIWVFPSPNLATLDTAAVYPGLCLVEGTNLSEGRGTAHPFELIGAPWLNSREIVSRMNGLQLPGVRFRHQDFQPWASKYRGTTCRGIYVHVTDRSSFKPLPALLHLLAEIIRLHPQELEFRPGFDRLAGNSWIRRELMQGTAPERIQARWLGGLEEFLKVRERFLLYPASTGAREP